MNGHPKAKGERGVLCAIGEFAKMDVPVSMPLSDNLPYDLIIDYAGKLWKVQVKSSTRPTTDGSIGFDLTSNNWYSKTVKRYTVEDCDLFVLYDLVRNACYIIGPEHFSNRRNFTVRFATPKNRQSAMCHMHDDFLLTESRLQYLTMPR